MHLPVFCVLALLAAFCTLATPASSRADVNVSLPPALGGFFYKGCLGGSPISGTSFRADPSRNSYIANGQPSNMTMGFMSDNFWCLVGDPNTYGTYNFSVVAWPWGNDGDGVGQGSPLETFTVSISAYLPKFIMEGPSQGQIGTAFSTQLQIYSDPSSSFGWSATVVEGSLPPGLTISGNGKVTGTPTQPGTYNLTTEYTTSEIPWQDSKRPRHSWTITIGGQVVPPTPPAPPMALGPPTLGNGIAYAPYNRTLAVSNGTAPFTFSLAEGTLPAGVTLGPTGVLSGTPTKAGDYTFVVKVADSKGATATQSYTVTISWPQLVLEPAVLLPATVGKRYSARLSVFQGQAPYTFALKKGTVLPRGLALTRKGLITGIPKVAGTFRITVTFTDVNGAPGEDQISLRIKKAPKLVKKPKRPSKRPRGKALSETGGGKPPPRSRLSYAAFAQIA